MASAAGGMDIEQVAAETPEKIIKETIEPDAFVDLGLTQASMLKSAPTPTVLVVRR